jgi:protein SCO1/2
MPRIRLALATGAACLAAAVIVLALAGRGSDRGAVDATTGFAGALRPAGMPTARFALHDQDGRVVDAATLRGRPAVVTFLYTSCRDTCPLVADQVRGALDQLGSASVPVVAVSVDPRGDTPLAAKRFLARHGLTGRARYLLGSRAALAPVWRQFGVRPQDAGSDHTPSTVLLDHRGVQRIGFLADELTPEALAHDIRRLSRA